MIINKKVMVNGEIEKIICDKCGEVIETNGTPYYAGFGLVKTELNTACSIGGRQIIENQKSFCYKCFKIIEQKLKEA